MKKYILLFILLPFLLSSCGHDSVLTGFYYQQKQKGEVTGFTVPGWLIKLGGGIASAAVADEETRLFLKLAKKMGRIRVLTAEEHNAVAQAEVRDFLEEVRNYAFEDLLRIRDEGTTVNIMVHEEENRIKDILLLVRESDEFIFVNARTNLKMEELIEWINEFMKFQNGEEEKAPEKIPQVYNEVEEIGERTPIAWTQ
ncbi:MAG: DUF4252 domain-containing protein [Saprospiraceae bacterium]|nr:DUF4252 domain-containing protein [Saprospiraceae bacterium]